MLYQNQLLDLLDRKFNFVDGLPAADFLLELVNFIHFSQTDEQLRIFSDYLGRRLSHTKADLALGKSQLIKELQDLRSDVTTELPQLDDGNTLPPNIANGIDSLDPYYKSLPCFDALAQKILLEISAGGVKWQNEDILLPMFNILDQKFDLAVMGIEVYERFRTRLENIASKDLHLRRRAINYFRSSPEAALSTLNYLVGLINPEPVKYHTLSDIMDRAIRGIFDDEVRTRLRIERIVYGGNEDPELITQGRIYLRKAYEGLRAEIGSHLIHFQIIQRYKIRCTWYDRDRLERLVKESEGSEEEALTRDLALYLFDNGISTLYRVRRGIHEYDLMGKQPPASIFIEVKVHKASKNPANGLAQLHSYLNTLESEDLSIWEVYYLVFRLGGPLYDIPWEIPTNHRTYYPVVIDLAPSSESGSRQGQPILLSLDDFFQALVIETHNDSAE
jgi:hypothetical protein